MKNYRILIVMLLVISVVVFSNRTIYALTLDEDGPIDMSETTYNKQTGVRVAGGLRFSIAEDRPVVHYGSDLQPEGLDKYLGKKMDKTAEILEGVLNRLVNIENRLEALESSTEQLSKQVDDIKNNLQ